MEDYCSNKQTVGESPIEWSVDEAQPEQSVGDKQSVGEASQYEKRHQLLMATHQYENYVKAATQRSQKSRSEKELRLLKKGLLLDYISDQSKKRKLRREKERKKEDGASMQMTTAGNVAIATSAGEEGRRKRKGNIFVKKRQQWLVHQQSTD